MPTFKNIDDFTLKSAATGTEEIQTSATEKVNTNQISALALKQVLTGFVASQGGATLVSANSTLLEAIQTVYKNSGRGTFKAISNGTTIFGNIAWSGTTAYGIVFDLNDQKIYFRNGWTQSSPTPDITTDAQWIAAVKLGNEFSLSSEDNLKVTTLTTTDVVDNVISASKLTEVINADVVVVKMGEMTMLFFTSKTDDTDVYFTSPIAAVDSNVDQEKLHLQLMFMRVVKATGQLAFAYADVLNPSWFENIPPGTLTITNFLYPGSDALVLSQGQIAPFYSPGGSNRPSGYSGSMFGYVQRDTTNGKPGFWYLAYGNRANASNEQKIWTGYTDGTTIKWTQVGDGGTQPVIVPNGDWVQDADFGFKKVGDMVPVIFEQGASGTPNSENAFSGYAICTTFTSSPLYWVADFVVSSPTYTEGTMFFSQVEYQNTPGWTRIGGTGASSGGGIELAGSESNYPLVSDEDVITLQGVKVGDYLLAKAKVAGIGTQTTPQGQFSLCFTVPAAGGSEIILGVLDINGNRSENFIIATTSAGDTAVKLGLTTQEGNGVAAMEIERMWKLP